MLDWSLIWKSILLSLAGILLLKILGRKSIAQMTLPETVVMLSIGTIIVQPIVGKGILMTIFGAAIFVVTAVILEFVQVKINMFEKIFTGKSKIVIENGKLNPQNLKKLRLTVDQLEMRMRNKGISKMEDVKIATIEPNGLLGYELKEDAKPVTVGELKKILNVYFPQQRELHKNETQTNMGTGNNNIFTEIKDSSKQSNPEYLQ